MQTLSAGVLTLNTVALLGAAGVDPEKAQDMADVLIEAELIGHTTHGLAQLETYLDALACGEMRGSGAVRVIRDRGACITWDGQNLPGGWLVKQALRLAYDRIADHGVVTIAIGQAHHTGALAVYLREITERGYIGQIQNSGPAMARIAPFGSGQPVLTPNPAALGMPTDGDPIMIDISASISTASMTMQLARSGGRFPEPWAMSVEGVATDDPTEITERGGSLLPLGGHLKGHKGYAMSLGVDVLTQGLAGFGRADQPTRRALSVFIQVIDPESFAGLDEFRRQSSYTADKCRTAPPFPGQAPVRVPGDAAAAKRRKALKDGIALPPPLLQSLRTRAERMGVLWQE